MASMDTLCVCRPIEASILAPGNERFSAPCTRAELVLQRPARTEINNSQHLVKHMKFPFLTLTAAAVLAMQSPLTAAEAEKDIVDTAVAAGSFGTLATALQAAGLVETLKGDGPFTVFAPTDDAFAKLPAGTVEDLLKPENKEKLTSILTYHVVPGKVMASDVKPGAVTTVQGSDLTISVDGGSVKVNDATVVTTDVAASNGVIHVIDTVVLPPQS